MKTVFNRVTWGWRREHILFPFCKILQTSWNSIRRQDSQCCKHSLKVTAEDPVQLHQSVFKTVPCLQQFKAGIDFLVTFNSMAGKGNHKQIIDMWQRPVIPVCFLAVSDYVCFVLRVFVPHDNAVSCEWKKACITLLRFLLPQIL